MRRCLRPALISGPGIAVATFNALMLLSIALGDGGAGMLPIMAIGSLFAAIAGLIVATPLALICASLLLRGIARNPLWAHRGRWIAAGAIVGAAVTMIVWLLVARGSDSELATAIVATVMGALPGAGGAWLNRAMLNDTIVGLTQSVDADVFA